MRSYRTLKRPPRQDLYKPYLLIYESNILIWYNCSNLKPENLGLQLPFQWSETCTNSRIFFIQFDILSLSAGRFVARVKRRLMQRKRPKQITIYFMLFLLICPISRLIWWGLEVTKGLHNKEKYFRTHLWQNWPHLSRRKYQNLDSFESF